MSEETNSPSTLFKIVDEATSSSSGRREDLIKALNEHLEYLRDHASQSEEQFYFKDNLQRITALMVALRRSDMIVTRKLLEFAYNNGISVETELLNTALTVVLSHKGDGMTAIPKSTRNIEDVTYADSKGAWVDSASSRFSRIYFSAQAINDSSAIIDILLSQAGLDMTHILNDDDNALTLAARNLELEAYTYRKLLRFAMKGPLSNAVEETDFFKLATHTELLRALPCIYPRLRFNSDEFARDADMFLSDSDEDMLRHSALEIAMQSGNHMLGMPLLEYHTQLYRTSSFADQKRLPKALKHLLQRAFQFALLSGNIIIAFKVEDCIKEITNDPIININNMLREMDDAHIESSTALSYSIHKRALTELAECCVQRPPLMDAFLELFPHFKYPDGTLHDPLLVLFKKLCVVKDDAELLHNLLKIAKALKSAAQRRATDRHQLLKKIESIENAVERIFTSSAMTSRSRVRDVLCRSAASLLIRHQNSLVDDAHGFYGGPLQIALEDEILSLFGTPQLNSYVESLFWGSLKKLSFTRFRMYNKNHTAAKDVEFPMIRYCPAYMFLLCGACKIGFMLLVSYVSVVEYKELYEDGGRGGVAPVSLAEGSLIIWTLAAMMHTYGELGGTTVEPWRSPKSWNWRRGTSSYYVMDVWNQLDIIAEVFLALWMLLLSTLEQRINGRAFLASAAIPLSVGLLQYMCLVENLGHLVIMIFAMAFDLLMFLIVYLVCIFGFGVAMESIFFRLDDFQNERSTFLTLVDATLGSHDFSAFLGTHPFYAFGLTIEIIFICTSSIILINLLIAKMANTYSRYDVKADKILKLLMTSNTKAHLLVGEKSPLCILPAPLNLVTILLYPVHYICVNSAFYGVMARSLLGFDVSQVEKPHPKSKRAEEARRKKIRAISIAGTVSDWLLGVPFVFLIAAMECWTSLSPSFSLNFLRKLAVATISAPYLYVTNIAYLSRKLFSTRVYLECYPCYPDDPFDQLLMISYDRVPRKYEFDENTREKLQQVYTNTIRQNSSTLSKVWPLGRLQLFFSDCELEILRYRRILIRAMSGRFFAIVSGTKLMSLPTESVEKEFKSLPKEAGDKVYFTPSLIQLPLLEVVNRDLRIVEDGVTVEVVIETFETGYEEVIASHQITKQELLEWARSGGFRGSLELQLCGSGHASIELPVSVSCYLPEINESPAEDTGAATASSVDESSCCSITNICCKGKGKVHITSSEPNKDNSSFSRASERSETSAESYRSVKRQASESRKSIKQLSFNASSKASLASSEYNGKDLSFSWKLDSTDHHPPTSGSSHTFKRKFMRDYYGCSDTLVSHVLAAKQEFFESDDRKDIFEKLKSWVNPDTTQ